MTSLRTYVSCLPQKDFEFLKRLVHFGGACTRWQVQAALGIKDRENARLKLQKFVRRDLLYAEELNGVIPNGPTVYLPTRALAQLLGCDRREPRDPELIVEKSYRFFVASCEAEAVNYLSEPSKIPVEAKVLKDIESAHRDEIYLPEANTVVIDLQPTWPRAKTKNRILFWAQVLPTANIELCSAFAKTCDLAKKDLPLPVQRRITKMQQRYEPLSAMYAYSYKSRTEDNDDDSIA